ncbi:hypothetical protein MKX01_005834 [Papaver californicum]|nr:hypothetical protein MKX01_005834 [Papaver californicum]
MDLDKTEFLLRSYLQTRLQKIEKYMIHISKTELWNRLSEPEQNFTTSCNENMENHLKQSVLSRFPYGYQDFLSNLYQVKRMIWLVLALNICIFCKQLLALFFSDKQPGSWAFGSGKIKIFSSSSIATITPSVYIISYSTKLPFTSFKTCSEFPSNVPP